MVVGGNEVDAMSVELSEVDVLSKLDAAPIGSVLEAAERIGANRGSSDVIALYQRWIERNCNAAGLHVAWFNLGVELSHAGHCQEALFAFKNAVALKPDLVEASIALGQCLEQNGQIDDALRCWAEAIQPQTSRIKLHNQRARLLEQSGRLREAEMEMRASLFADPAQPDVIQHWIYVRQRMCAWPILSDEVPGLSREKLIRACGPLSAMALFDDVSIQTAVNAEWLQRRTKLAPLRLSPLAGYRHDRIRIGYMSSDFCRHAMSYLVAELFERHDRSRFEIYGYCASPEDGSDVRSRIVAAFDHFRRIGTISDETVAQLIRLDEIDILIDLNGLTAGNRLPVLRWRPAPIQATYLGFVGPVPLPELDYLFCDDFVVPDAVASVYSPRPLPIAENYQANDTKRSVLAVTMRSECCLPEERFVFCCLSNHYKITSEVFSAWMKILSRTGDSVLWLAVDNPVSCENLRKYAATCGVDPNRLIFSERCDPNLYMARLRLADLFLDTFPYNAGTVASDAIRMGLPMVTLAGQSFASRMASRLLHAIGAQAGIADSLEAYIETAVSLATDHDIYATYKAKVTEETWTDTIGNIGRFTEQFEATLGKLCVRSD